MSKKSILLFVCSLFILSVFSQAKLLVDFQQKGASVFPSMYGIFFEEINHSGDGALYAELIQNQGFEEYMYLLSLGCEYRNGFPEGARAIGGYDYKSKKIVIKVLNGMGGTFLRYRTKHL